MKKLISLLITILLFCNFNANATKWRVNNKSTVTADYTSLTACLAADTVKATDTIYLEPSTVNYGDITISKQVCIFGPGNFLNQNPETQPLPITANLGVVDINVSGCILSGIYITNSLNINASNTIIKRNRIIYRGIEIAANLTNIMILQNYIRSTYAYGGETDNDAIYILGGCSNIIISNNYLRYTNTTNAVYDAIEITGSSSATITNNVIEGQFNIIYSTVTNNIFINNGPSYSFGTCTISNNIFNGAIVSGDDLLDNKINVSTDTIWDISCETCSSTDGRYQIPDTAFAKTYGIDGTEVGMFGGADPYVLSGIPAIPAIYFLSAPTTGSAESGLPVHVKVKARK